MVSPTDITLAAYQERADRYFAASPSRVSDRVAVFLDALAGLVPGGRVLELGSGPGREATYLERRGLTVDRTDATPAFIDKLLRDGYTARMLDARTGSYGQSYDAVLANAVLLHFDRAEFESVLVKCRAATRPSGYLALTLKDGDGEAWSSAKLGTPRWFVFWREDQLREVLTRTGWDVVTLEHVPGRIEPWLQVLGRQRLDG